MVKTIDQNRLKQKFIRISTKKGGSTIKIFGDDLNPSIPYKTFILSAKDTAEWIVKEMLVKYGLKHENSQNYCLIQINIPPYNQIDNKIIEEIILHDKDCPLNIYLNHKQKNQGTIVFKVIKCSLEYIEIRKQLHTNDRIVNDHYPFFVEINYDGSDLPTPRVFKLYPNTTYVGSDVNIEKNRQYFYIDGIGINRDHCRIENSNGIVTLIPCGEIWLDRKFISRPFILQHRALVCFGRNSTFRYYDQKMKLIFTQRNSNNHKKLSTYASLPTLSTNDLQVEIEQKNVMPADVLDPKLKFNVLPGLLEVPIETEIRFLHAVFANYPLNNIHFRLLPAYICYMIIRYRLSPYRKTTLSPIEKSKDVVSLLYRIEKILNKKIEECQKQIGYLAYWLSNTSEFVYFLKHDRDLSKISSHLQIRLTKHIEYTFYYLINLLQHRLDEYLLSFTNPRDNRMRLNKEQFSENRWIIAEKNFNEHHQPTIDDLLALFSSILELLRKCRVNPAFTIAIFSHLFHYINTWLLNRIVCCPELKLCTRFWGEKISFRLRFIYHWALKQGLETSAEYYLLKINQLCSLLKSPKRDIYDAEQLIANEKLQINSIQIKQILNNFILSPNESPISNDFSQSLLSIAHNHVDENLHREGHSIELAEESNLNLPFTLTDDGYTCENLRGIPQELFDFIKPMTRLGLCRLYTNSYSIGLWTEFIEISNNENNGYDNIETIVLNKKHNSLGLTIVSAANESQQIQGIYIKGIIPGSAAEDDGRLQPGDQILSVNQIKLQNTSREEAIELLKQSESSVTLQVLKNAANYHGLSPLFPSSDHQSSILEDHQDGIKIHTHQNGKYENHLNGHIQHHPIQRMNHQNEPNHLSKYAYLSPRKLQQRKSE